MYRIRLLLAAILLVTLFVIRPAHASYANPTLSGTADVATFGYVIVQGTNFLLGVDTPITISLMDGTIMETRTINLSNPAGSFTWAVYLDQSLLNAHCARWVKVTSPMVSDPYNIPLGDPYELAYNGVATNSMAWALAHLTGVVGDARGQFANTATLITPAQRRASLTALESARDYLNTAINAVNSADLADTACGF